MAASFANKRNADQARSEMKKTWEQLGHETIWTSISRLALLLLATPGLDEPLFLDLQFLAGKGKVRVVPRVLPVCDACKPLCSMTLVVALYLHLHRSLVRGQSQREQRGYGYTL